MCDRDVHASRVTLAVWTDSAASITNDEALQYGYATNYQVLVLSFFLFTFECRPLIFFGGGMISRVPLDPALRKWAVFYSVIHIQKMAKDLQID